MLAFGTVIGALMQVFVFQAPVYARLALFPFIFLSHGFLASEKTGM